MFQSVPHMLFSTIKQYPDNIALRFKRNGEIKQLTYQQFGERIQNLTHGLDDIGLKARDKIAILSNNRPEWTISDFAVFCLRGIMIPIYQTLPANQIAYILKNSNTRAIFVENKAQYQKIISIKNQLPKLEFIFSFDELPDAGDDVKYFKQLMIQGEKHRQSQPDFFEKSIQAIQPQDICSIVYTSGTTGDPKGVMLHHHGFLTDIINAEAVLNLNSDDIFLSFLPLSHLYERLAGHWCPMYRG